MANGLNLWHPVEAPPAVPYRFGLFSVVQARTADLTAIGVDEHWRLGVTWSSQACQMGDITQGPCIDPEGPFVPGAPLTNYWCTPNAQFDPFTVYVYNTDSIPGFTLEQHMQQTTDRLLNNEQRLVEQQVVANLAACSGSPVDLTDYPVEWTLGYLENMLSARYGGTGVIWMSRQTATVLWENLRIEGGKLVTTVGTPVVAYAQDVVNPPATTADIFITGAPVMYRGDVDVREAAITKAINEVSYVAQRDYVVGWDCICHAATIRLAPTPV